MTRPMTRPSIVIPDGDGLRHQITAPLPIRIDQYDDRVVINYEYWKAVRTVSSR